MVLRNKSELSNPTVFNVNVIFRTGETLDAIPLLNHLELIEICYSRQIPRLQGARENVVKLRTLGNIEARLPAVEELCGEKIAAFFYLQIWLIFTWFQNYNQ